MTVLAGFLGLGWPELIIILVVVLLLFGGTRLAGLGKSTGRALREFKEETKNLGGDKDKKADADAEAAVADDTKAIDAEIVEPTNEQIQQQKQTDALKHDA